MSVVLRQAACAPVSRRYKMSSTDQRQEREVITELIDLYRDLPCLWDITSDSYKDARKKKTAWEILLNKYKEFDPTASDATVKRKIDILKFGYRREAKKVKESKNRRSSTVSDLHKPNLWYYDQMMFLEDKTEANRSGEDNLMSEDEEESLAEGARESKLSREQPPKKKQKLIDLVQDLMKEKNKDINSFGIYVGEKLDKIQEEQRDIAEKLISEVIFLAKINKLSHESKVCTPP